MLLLLLISPAIADPTGTDPRKVVVDFYTWHARHQADDWTHYKAVFDSTLYNAMLGASKIPIFRQGNAWIDADPFLNSQDATVFGSAGTPIVRGDEAKVSVTTMTRGQHDPGSITVILRRSAGGWKIADFVGRAGSPNPSLLRWCLSRVSSSGK